MKKLALTMKKLCALMLVLVMAFGVSVASSDTVHAAGNTKYWIKVNKQANVATVYQLQDGKYKPIKAFLVSCGGANTPSGTYYTPAKYRWHTLQGPSYGQYCTRIHQGVLFHSVWYYSHSKASQATKEFNKLGTTASHGCVRLAVIDAKWIYDHCPLKTKVTIYSSKNPGPLGKPKGIKVSTARKMYWDPTDPDKNNPYNKQKPVITISSKKARTAEYGSNYNVMAGVSAKQQTTGISLTSKIKYSVKKYDSKKKAYVKASFSTKTTGTYKFTYTVKSLGGTSASKDFTMSVVDTKAPVISAKNRTVRVNEVNAVSGVSAKTVSGQDRTTAMNVKIKAPGAKTYTSYTYSQAKAYKFAKAGTYSVQYTAKSANKPYRSSTKTVTITCYSDAQITQKKDIVVKEGASDAQITQAVIEAVSVKDNGETVKITAANVTLVKNDEKQVVKAEVSYKGKSGYTVTKQFDIICKTVQFEETTESTTAQTTTEQPASTQTTAQNE